MTPIKVLVVDDNIDAATSLADLLRFEGYETQVAFTGPEALTVCQLFCPQVVLLDIGLPGMSGYEVCLHWRQIPAYQTMRVIAVTGYSAEPDRLKSAEVGMTDHLVKPVVWDELKKTLEKHVKEERQ